MEDFLPRRFTKTKGCFSFLPPSAGGRNRGGNLPRRKSSILRLHDFLPTSSSEGRDLRRMPARQAGNFSKVKAGKPAGKLEDLTFKNYLTFNLLYSNFIIIYFYIRNIFKIVRKAFRDINLINGLEAEASYLKVIY